MLKLSTTPEGRREIIIDIVRSFFPKYTSSSDEVYSTIEEHIETHGYFLQNEHEVDISEDEIFTSWQEYVLDPILTMLASQSLRTNLEDPLEDYILLSRIWFSLSKERSFHGFEHLQAAFKQYKRTVRG